MFVSNMLQVALQYCRAKL